MLKLYVEYATSDPWAYAIMKAQNDKRIHVGIVEEDGSIFSARIDKGVCRQQGVDLADATACRVISLPWADTPDAKAWRDAQIGLPYDLLGAIFSLAGKGLRLEPAWFCSHVTREAISRLAGAPQTFCALPDPALLADQVESFITQNFAIRPPRIGCTLQPLAELVRIQFVSRLAPSLN
jgi:hypothetical protein